MGEHGPRACITVALMLPREYGPEAHAPRVQTQTFKTLHVHNLTFETEGAGVKEKG